MERITLVVEFEDGMCPGFSKGMDVLGGKLAAVTFRDELQHKGNEISSVRRINISANSLYSYLSGGE